jgi:hypothetical protein
MPLTPTFEATDIVVIKDFRDSKVTLQLYKIFYGNENVDIAEATGNYDNYYTGYPSVSLDNLTNINTLSIPTRIQANAGGGIGDADITVNGDEVTLSLDGDLATTLGFTINDVGAFLYNGTNLNELVVIGKIKQYISASSVILQKANTTIYTNVPAFILRNQNNFGYLENGSFLVLIKPVSDGEGSWYVPAINQLQRTVDNLPDVNPTYINLYKISKDKDKGNTTIPRERVRASIKRLSGFVGESKLPSTTGSMLWTSPVPNDDLPSSNILKSFSDIPHWVAYIIDPYEKEPSKNLVKGTSYMLEISNTLPTPSLPVTNELRGLQVDSVDNNILSYNGII